MKRNQFILLVVVLGALGGAAIVFATKFGSAQEADAQTKPADESIQPDLVLLHGKILTVDAKDSVAQAIAIRHGKIVAVGAEREIEKMASAASQVVDLHGRTATPGLIDSHGHFAHGGVNELYHIDLSNVSRVSDVLDKLREKAATLKPGEWIRGDGWDEGKLEERRYLFASDLDKVTPNNPVWLTHTTGHYGVANSVAMKLAHITAQTQPPPAGTIDRDAKGVPTGVLKESAMSLVTDLIPATTPEQERNGILHVLDELHQECMTAVKDADIQPRTWEAYKEVLNEGKLQEHVFVLWHAGATMGSARQALARISALPKPPQSLGDGRLLSGGAKFYMDGSGGARTAWVHKEWNKNSTDIDEGNFGYPVTDPEVYRQAVRLFHDAGVHVGTHAVGDHAIDWVVDTYAQVLKEKPTHGLRHSIIHANIPTDHAIDEMARLEKQYDAGYPESQGPFTWWIGDTYAGNFGPERAARLNPFKTYVAKGIHWGGGSDFFVTPLPARFGIWASVAREPLKGVYGAHPFGTAESVDAHAALRSYTIWASHQLFLDDRIGSLEPGKDADIAVWDRDPYTVPTGELKNMRCEMTIFGGQIVYKAASQP
ncbi:MAG TPA: amidohydrolase family protein [Candidatus Sulfotelmatobacter sp.]|nr:amidohydrolase family protein [Candidatus Sulfotelmatobacter sp.]